MHQAPGGKARMDARDSTRRRSGGVEHDGVASPNGGAVNPSYRQTTQRGVCETPEDSSLLGRKNIFNDYIKKILFTDKFPRRLELPQSAPTARLITHHTEAGIAASGVWITGEPFGRTDTGSSAEPAAAALYTGIH